MTKEFEQKLADLLPDARHELERAQAAYAKSLATTRLLEQKFREAQDLVATLTTHAERAKPTKGPEPEPVEAQEGHMFEFRMQTNQLGLDRSKPPQTLRRGEQQARVVKFVNEHDRPVTIAEVADFYEDDRNRIGSALWKAELKGLIKKLDDGLYARNDFVSEPENPVMSS